jgi:hypothetical protein
MLVIKKNNNNSNNNHKIRKSSINLQKLVKIREKIKKTKEQIKANQ